MSQRFSEDTWNAWVDDDEASGAPPVSNTDIEDLGAACPAAVVDVMIDTVTANRHGWSVDDAKRVAMACDVSYTPGTTRDSDPYGYDEIGRQHIRDHYPDWDSGLLDRLYATGYARIVGRVVAEAETEAGTALWFECGYCGSLHHFDPAKITGRV